MDFIKVIVSTKAPIICVSLENKSRYVDSMDDLKLALKELITERIVSRLESNKIKADDLRRRCETLTNGAVALGVDPDIASKFTADGPG